MNTLTLDLLLDDVVDETAQISQTKENVYYQQEYPIRFFLIGTHLLI